MRKLIGTILMAMVVLGAYSMIPEVAPYRIVWAQSGGCPTGTTAALGFQTVNPASGATNRPVCVDGATGQYILRPRYLEIEGATEDAFETLVQFTEPTADNTVTFPDASGVPLLSTAAIGAANAVWMAANALVFEGATANDFETTLTLVDPTADRTITMPNATGTVSLAVAAPCAAAGATCTETTTQGVKTIYGTTAVLDGASPSVAAVTFSVGFTATTSYSCAASPVGATAAIAAAGVAVTYTSATVVTFTSLNGGTHAIRFICMGT